MEKEIIKPEVGMGATLCFISDSEPYTIIDISENGKRMTIQMDDWKRLDKNGQSESQEYEYTQNENNPKLKVSLRKDGIWKVVTSDIKVRIGDRRKYEDPCY